jgi:hypothetical protein
MVFVTAREIEWSEAVSTGSFAVMSLLRSCLPRKDVSQIVLGSSCVKVTSYTCVNYSSGSIANHVDIATSFHTNKVISNFADSGFSALSPMVRKPE